MTFDQFLRILRARWKLSLSIFAVVVLATIVGSLVFPKKYEASATVIIDSRPDAVSPMQAINGVSAMSYLATQIDVIGSRAVSQRVVRTMRFGENPTLRADWEKESKGRGSYEVWLADLMSKGLKVRPSRESNVIEITYEGSDPAFAAAMANAFASAYIDTTVQFRVNPARQFSDFFEERARLARSKLEQAQQKLAQTQEAKGILATDERLDVEVLRLNDLSQQVLALRANRSDAQNRSRESLRNPSGSPEVISNQLVASLKADLARSEVKLNELLERYGDMHPNVINERANVSNLRSQIQRETALVTRSLGVTSTVSVNRESEINNAYEAQREKVLKMKAARSELSVLEREVENAQRIYDAIVARLSQTNLEGSTSQAGVMVLSPAVEPTKPSSPKMLLNVVISIVLGALLAMMAAMGMELIDRRVRSADDLTQLFEVAVLGTLPSPDKRPSRIRLSLSQPKRHNRAALT
jgi:chain length determinant protein EpsF